MDGATALSLIGRKNKKQGKKSRKHRRNYRWDYTEHSVTKYRARHGIGPGPRRKA
jgi:hypothetical protein